MKPITLGIRREIAKNRPNDRPRNFYEYGSFQSRDVTLSIWGCNSNHVDRQFTLKISAYDIATNWRVDLPEQEITLGENRSTELWSGKCPEPPLDQAYDKVAPSGTVVIHAILIGENGEVVARFSNWPQPYKLLDLPDPGLKLDIGEGEIRVDVERPAKGVWLSVEGSDEGVEFGDNSLDLFPGDAQVISVTGVDGRMVMAAWLGKERAGQV